MTLTLTIIAEDATDLEQQLQAQLKALAYNEPKTAPSEPEPAPALAAAPELPIVVNAPGAWTPTPPAGA